MYFKLLIFLVVLISCPLRMTIGKSEKLNIRFRTYNFFAKDF